MATGEDEYVELKEKDEAKVKVTAKPRRAYTDQEVGGEGGDAATRAKPKRGGVGTRGRGKAPSKP
jgi:hypothetical protein